MVLCDTMQALLNKQPLRRPCCEQLLQHPFLAEVSTAAAIEAETGPLPASQASQDVPATKDGPKLVKAGSRKIEGPAPGAGVEGITSAPRAEQPSLAPSSAGCA